MAEPRRNMLRASDLVKRRNKRRRPICRTAPGRFTACGGTSAALSI